MTRRAATGLIEIHAPEDFPETTRNEIHARLFKVARRAHALVQGMRLTLRHPETRRARSRWVADASLVLGGRLVAAHATGPDATQAAKEAAERLQRQLRRVADTGTVLRNERRGYRPRPHLKPPDLRDLIPRRTEFPFPETTLEAAADLLDLEIEFLLFRHVRTSEDVVVYRRDDGRIGLLHPPGSALADENDIVVPQASRYREPIPLSNARDEMDVLGHRFVYFIDAADGRGKVLYLRQDGDYGLVEPAPAP
jgi:ribosome-associated translation inhibitor RaiA